MRKIQKFSSDYPFNIRVYNDTSEKIDLPDVKNCGNEQCSYTYFVLSDFSQTNEKISGLPQVLFVAGIHGDEIVGPNVLIYLASYLLENYQRNETLKYYMQNRLLVFFPMSNPVGFYYKKREEAQKSHSLDPNRDFPYNVKENECFRTATGLMINHIYEQYLIRTAISFHGGDNSITYPWGGYNHALRKQQTSYLSELSPDDKAFSEIASELVSVAGENPSKGIDKYLEGTMNEVVYPVNGGLEDWVYAGGWENNYSGSAQIITPCNVKGQKIQTNSSHIRSVLFLVEAGDPKDPPESSLGKISGLLEKNADNWGHINRNIALSLDLIRISSPFIILNEIKFEEYFVEINWEVGGCLKVSSAILLWKDHDPLDIKENFDGYNFTYVNSSYEWHRIQNINNNFSKISSKFKFKNQFDLNSSQKIDILIAMQCDQEWGKIKENSVPLAPPQSHLVQSRTKDDYFVKNNGFKIFSDKTVYKFLKKITNTEYKIKNEYISQVEVKFHKCSSFGSKKDYEENNFLIFTNSLNKIEIKGNIKYFSNKFAATLFNNGDISSCDSIHLGRNLNVFNEKFQQKTLDLLNYEKSSTVFLENNESSDYLSLSVSKKQFLNTSVLNMMLGHSLLLSNSNDKKDVLIGQVRIIQKYQCEEEAKNCVGAELNNDGLCLLMDEFKMDKKDDYLIKIAIKPNEYNQTVYIKILADLKRLSFIYDQINKIIIRNQDTQIDFLIKEGKVMPSNIFLSESKSFNLELKNALSNKLVIYIEKGGQQFKIGLCDIVYVENLVLYLEDGIDNTMNEESMKKESNIVVLIMTNLAAFIFLIFLIFSIRIIVRERFSQKKETETNELVMPNQNSSDILGHSNRSNTTPKFIDIENKKNSIPQTLNDDMDSDKI